MAPHRSETFKFSTDPQFIEKVRDIVGLYLDPPERALVLCADEKSQIQALDRTQPLLPMRPGQIERRSHDYERHGAIVNACHSGKGGTGDVAILSAANRMQLMPFAQIATRVGGAITVTLALIVLSRMP